jgi:hypothetical protein
MSRYAYSVATSRSPTAFKFRLRTDACRFAKSWGKLRGNGHAQVFKLDAHGKPLREEHCTGGVFGGYKRRSRRRRK